MYGCGHEYGFGCECVHGGTALRKEQRFVGGHDPSLHRGPCHHRRPSLGVSEGDWMKLTCHLEGLQVLKGTNSCQSPLLLLLMCSTPRR